jgi:hypothetical protein
MESIPAKSDEDITTFQSTLLKTAEEPRDARKVCAIVRIALIPAAFSHILKFALVIWGMLLGIYLLLFYDNVFGNVTIKQQGFP